MVEKLILILALGAAIAYLAFRLRRSFKEPGCTCDEKSDCPYAKSLSPGSECPFSETSPDQGRVCKYLDS